MATATQTKRKKAQRKPKTSRPAGRETSPDGPRRGTTGREFEWFVARAKLPRLRSMREFAEAEIVIPDGPFEGRRFRCDRQPYTGLFFDEVDSGRWNRFAAVGPTQTGKTLTCYVIPVIYHLFEIKETVIGGLPDMNMGGDKWREDFKPVIDRSRYADQLPTSGRGSRGGSKIESITFRDGQTFKYMSGGGGDKQRAAYTTRVVAITEVDGLDESSATSRETDKVTQIESRTKAFDDEKMIYLECTVTIEEGRIWQEKIKGSDSTIVCPCPHCGDYVAPERAHLLGWQDAATELEAFEGGYFACPGCGSRISDAERVAMNRNAKLIHKGQSIDKKGRISGPMPQTRTLGFRWSAFHNLFWTAGTIAKAEWLARQRVDEDEAEKEMCQFWWAIPFEPAAVDVTPLTVDGVMSRRSKLRRGIVPADTQYLTMHVDIGKWKCHWSMLAFRENELIHCVDYDVFEVATKQLGVERAVLVGLREFRDRVLEGFRTEDDGFRVPDQVWVDGGYLTDVIKGFCEESREIVGSARFRVAVGLGHSQAQSRAYAKPQNKTRKIRIIGEGYHLTRGPGERAATVQVDADQWKLWLHERLASPVDEAGALTLFEVQGRPKAHFDLAKHLTAEHLQEEFVVGKGTILTWIKDRKQNHWLDNFYNCCAAGHLCGWRLTSGTAAATPTAGEVITDWFAQQKERKGR